MFEIGWTEMLVIAIVMIVVVGPKDLPKMLRTFGKTAAKLRSMAGDFQKQFNEALKEAELDEVKKSVDTLRGLNPTAEIKKQLNPFEKAAADVRAGLDAAMKPKPSTAAEPAPPVTHVAEPLKTGATEMPGVPVAEGKPAHPPAFTPMPDPVVAASTAAVPVAPAAAETPVAVNGVAAKVKPARKPAPAAAKPAVSAPKPKAAAAKQPGTSSGRSAAKVVPPAKTTAAKPRPAKKPVDSTN